MLPIYITLDVSKPPGCLDPIRLRCGEARAVSIVAHIVDSGDDVQLGGCTASFQCILPGGGHVIEPCAMDGCHAKCDLPAEVAAKPGLIETAYIAIDNGETHMTTQDIPIEIGDGGEAT